MSDCGDVKKVFVPTKEEKAPAVPSPQGLEVSDIAAEKIITFCKADGKDPEKFGLKISVVTDGCSGKSYTMDLAEVAPHQEKGDKVFQKNGANVIVEKLSYMFVIGSVLDYAETLLMSGFQLNNPNVKGTCSCGSSFAV